MGAAELKWPERMGRLREMQAAGQLTEADVYEMEGLIELLAERWSRGEITDHFVELVLQKLADDKTRDWLARTGRTGVWGK